MVGTLDILAQLKVMPFRGAYTPGPEARVAYREMLSFLHRNGEHLPHTLTMPTPEQVESGQFTFTIQIVHPNGAFAGIWTEPGDIFGSIAGHIDESAIHFRKIHPIPFTLDELVYEGKLPRLREVDYAGTIDFVDGQLRCLGTYSTRESANLSGGWHARQEF